MPLRVTTTRFDRLSIYAASRRQWHSRKDELLDKLNAVQQMSTNRTRRPRTNGHDRGCENVGGPRPSARVRRGSLHSGDSSGNPINDPDR